ncbi:serine hydrolase domain-containing protein [Caulobacter endophyticus]|uniref:serine hydrolase domain-containing protein n=1 Tax=Caulobacter endophyticus TaxID=2172652 RepID=UPI00240EFE66|nr:serine hydrolase domain-containing protein [Caulobacter endophyticus]MDG2530100.1 serine hydrolase [Caulobacter endophyticus]
MIDRRGLFAAAGALCAAPGLSLAAPARLGADNPVVDAFVAEQKFQGVVMIGRKGRASYVRAFGMADIEAQKPATRDTVYAIASISKWLTTIAVLRLVEQGKLSLDAPIATWLPRQRPDTGKTVTLTHLLSNTSGVPNGFTPALKIDPEILKRELSAAQAVILFCQGDPLFPPGSKFDYALTNWFVVTAIVEAVTGKPFQAVVEELVTGPLKMSHTRAGRIDAEAGVAASYYAGPPLARRENPRLSVMAAGGGYFSTVDDLLVAAHIVFDTPFLSEASRKALTTILVPEQDYALGGRVRSLTIDGQVKPAGWETGRTAGYRSVLGHRLDTGDTVVILNNTDLSQKALDLFADKLLGAAPRA